MPIKNQEQLDQLQNELADLMEKHDLNAADAITALLVYAAQVWVAAQMEPPGFAEAAQLCIDKTLTTHDRATH